MAAKKGQRLFRLGTTSFIYPDHILPNVKKLGAFFDEIELLIFESCPETVLPSKNEVNDLLAAAQDLDLTYNIHLPTDISLTCESLVKRQQAADMYLKVIERFEKLQPTTHTLHLDMPETVKNSDRQMWQENAHDGLEKLLSGGMHPDIFSIETLDYPFSIVEPLVNAFNLPVCMDLGHLIKYGDNIQEIYQAHQSRIPVMHLHGVEFSGDTVKDHTRLDRMPETAFRTILDILETYPGVVSIEVFNLENLKLSMKFLSQFFSDIPEKNHY
ncbi:MAG: TIM barrel protein [Proteobacteria bacterium]|nr:TIM barrel protein [Pseudomonadota bacterium]MBU1386348.1 TIM barrel protein [Pseudomonadota bacterium]MBU1541366.1 TIM barrel protein [Pseudomonadota bacterium]MBU2482509.1 TIM barrel protein [Pseudomonadota bacterium]